MVSIVLQSPFPERGFFTAVVVAWYLAGSKARPCLNVAGQTKSHKRLVVTRSGIHGWGACTLEAVEKNDFIYEYTGELISQVSLRLWDGWVIGSLVMGSLVMGRTWFAMGQS